MQVSSAETSCLCGKEILFVHCRGLSEDSVRKLDKVGFYFFQTDMETTWEDCPFSSAILGMTDFLVTNW
ncbi:hypothetical protein ACQP3J_30385, partial [Escherichia coli]